MPITWVRRHRGKHVHVRGIWWFGLLGVQLPAVMEIVDWSNTKVAKRYSSVTATIQDNIASQVNTLQWGSQ